jgi:hypothetical protein
MIRHCAVRPDVTDSTFMAEHLIKTIVDQAHLCPLPLSSRPVLWAHDHTLWLLPTPHLIVVADKVDGYSFKYGEAIGLNPGSFGSDTSFSVYAPAVRSCQQCTLNPDENDSESSKDVDAHDTGEIHVDDVEDAEDVPRAGSDIAATDDLFSNGKKHDVRKVDILDESHDAVMITDARPASPLHSGESPLSPLPGQVDDSGGTETDIGAGDEATDM